MNVSLMKDSKFGFGHNSDESSGFTRSGSKKRRRSASLAAAALAAAAYVGNSTAPEACEENDVEVEGAADCLLEASGQAASQVPGQATGLSFQRYLNVCTLHTRKREKIACLTIKQTLFLVVV